MRPENSLKYSGSEEVKVTGEERNALCTAHYMHAVAQLVETLRFKLEGHGLDSRWCHWNFSLTSFRPHYDPGVDSASNRNKHQEYFLGVKAAGA